ncbi:MAG: NAD(P)H-binding protein [Flavisolibacter sp.]
MKYVITGAAGHISKPLSEKLLAAGHEVTVIGRNAENLKPLTDKGARPAIGSVEDVDFLKKAFAGADAVYLMVPPQYAGSDLDSYRQLGTRYAEAIKANNIKYAVTLSSIGAHLPQGCGPVSGLYLEEQELNKLTDVNILHVRPGFFYLNFLGIIPMVKGMNIIGGNYGDGEAKMVFSHPNDIAAAIAQALLNLSFKGHSVQYLASDVRATSEVARQIGTSIGKPDLPWIGFTDQQALDGMIQAGMPEGMAGQYAEMGNAMRTGRMWEDFWNKQPKEFGKTKLEDFAKEFAAVYNS